MEKVRCRVAPSPSGNLHLGTAHTALFNFIFAKHYMGDFILRIDDSDLLRSKKEYEINIMDSLKWLGIVWNEGPDIGGNYTPYRQSERGGIYKKYLEKLIKEKKAYYCYCTKEELEKERQELEKKKMPTKYSGKCRKLSEEQIRKYEKEGRKGAVRLINPNRTVSFVDLIRGKITVDSSLFGDFVTARSDGTALLNFAATVDDIEMKISHAIRGEDFLNMVPRQLLIFEALGAKPPKFAHLSFLYALDKTKLSKRHGATSLLEYKIMGYLPEAMVNYLGILGYSMPDGQEIIDLNRLIKEFDIKKVQKGMPIFNVEKLKWFNKKYIQEIKDQDFSKLVAPFSKFKDRDNFEEITGKTAFLIKPRISILSEYDNLAACFFERPQKYEYPFSDKKVWLEKLSNKLEKVSAWKADQLGNQMQQLVGDINVKGSDFFMTVRVAVTGKKISPPLNETMEILGKDEVIARIQAAVKNS